MESNDDSSSNEAKQRNAREEGTTIASHTIDSSVISIDEHNGDSETSSPTSSLRRAAVIKSRLIYLGTSLLAVTLSYNAPGTKLWLQNDESLTSVDRETLVELVAVFVLVWMTLLLVQGSDPGYLTADIVSQLCKEDGISLLGYDGTPSMETEEGDQLSLTPTVEMTTRRRSNHVRTDKAEDSTHLVASPSSPGLNESRDGNGLENWETSQEGTLSPLDIMPQPQSLPSPEEAYFKKRRRKVCQRCQFAPPLRSHHCKICDACVATFDHHCECCRIVHSSPYGSFHLLHVSKESNVPWMHNLIVIAGKLYLYPLTLITIMLWIAHTFFATANMTTFECGRSSKLVDYLEGTIETDLPFST
eukprot:scaffold175787_cov51-Attheya_sp.AAC.3